jgi:hypothetical protein
MAFFAVMLPDALSKPDDLKATIRASFNGLTQDQVRAKQAEMTKLGQLVRDAVVAAAVKKGTAIPASGTSSSGTTPTPAPAAAAAVTPTPAAPPVKKQKYNSANDVRTEWAKMREKARKEATSFMGPAQYITADTWDKANSFVNRFLKDRTDFSDTPEIDDMLQNARALLKFEDVKSKKKTGGSRHRTPRNRRSQKRSMKH